MDGDYRVDFKFSGDDVVLAKGFANQLVEWPSVLRNYLFLHLLFGCLFLMDYPSPIPLM
jgi:hypothetical protein